MDRPNVIRQPRFYSGSNTKTRMNTTEVVIRKMKSDCGPQIRQFLAVGSGEPGQSAKLHPQRRVLPFHIASRNVADTRVPDPDSGYNLRDSWWGVPPLIVLPIVPEQLDELREIHVQPERFNVPALCGGRENPTIVRLASLIPALF